MGAKTAEAPRIAAATYGTGDNENICRVLATVDARTCDFVAASSVGARAEWEGAWKAAAPATRRLRESFMVVTVWRTERRLRARQLDRDDG